MKELISTKHMTQEENSLLTYWCLSEDYIPKKHIIAKLLDDMESMVDSLFRDHILATKGATKEFCFKYGLQSESVSLDGILYFYSISDPWTWAKPTPEEFMLKLATKQIKMHCGWYDCYVLIGDRPL